MATTKRRLNDAEQRAGVSAEAHENPADEPIPWSVPPGHPGPMVDGERITWHEYERRFPGAPLPFRWIVQDESGTWRSSLPPYPPTFPERNQAANDGP